MEPLGSFLECCAPSTWFVYWKEVTSLECVLREDTMTSVSSPFHGHIIFLRGVMCSLQTWAEAGPVGSDCIYEALHDHSHSLIMGY